MTIRRAAARPIPLAFADDEGERFTIALEHVAFCAARGDSPAKIILSVGQPLPGNAATLADATYALVYAQIAMDRA